MAPTAMSTIDVPMVMSRCYPRHVAPTHLVKNPTHAGGAGSASHFAQLALDLPRHLALADRLALVIEVLALRQRDLDLGPRARPGEVHARRHQGQASLLRAAHQALDLGLVQQQLAG